MHKKLWCRQTALFNRETIKLLNSKITSNLNGIKYHFIKIKITMIILIINTNIKYINIHFIFLKPVKNSKVKVLAEINLGNS